jgi:hypothetical protein
MSRRRSPVAAFCSAFKDFGPSDRAADAGGNVSHLQFRDEVEWPQDGQIATQWELWPPC